MTFWWWGEGVRKQVSPSKHCFVSDPPYPFSDVLGSSFNSCHFQGLTRLHSVLKFSLALLRLILRMPWLPPFLWTRKLRHREGSRCSKPHGQWWSRDSHRLWLQKLRPWKVPWGQPGPFPAPMLHTRPWEMRRPHVLPPRRPPDPEQYSMIFPWRWWTCRLFLLWCVLASRMFACFKSWLCSTSAIFPV